MIAIYGPIWLWTKFTWADFTRNRLYICTDSPEPSLLKFWSRLFDNGKVGTVYGKNSIFAKLKRVCTLSVSSMLNNFDPVYASSDGSIESAHFADWPEPSLLNNFDPVYTSRLE